MYRYYSNRTVSGLKLTWTYAPLIQFLIQIEPYRGWNGSALGGEQARAAEFKSNRIGVETSWFGFSTLLCDPFKSNRIGVETHSICHGKCHSMENSNRTVSGLKQAPYEPLQNGCAIQIEPYRGWNPACVSKTIHTYHIQIEPYRGWNYRRRYDDWAALQRFKSNRIGVETCFFVSGLPLPLTIQIEPYRGWNRIDI